MTEAEQAFVAECIEQYEKDAPSQDREPETEPLTEADLWGETL